MKSWRLIFLMVGLSFLILSVSGSAGFEGGGKGILVRFALLSMRGIIVVSRLGPGRAIAAASWVVAELRERGKTVKLVLGDDIRSLKDAVGLFARGPDVRKGAEGGHALTPPVAVLPLPISSGFGCRKHPLPRGRVARIRARWRNARRRPDPGCSQDLKAFHGAWDISVLPGTKVRAVADGRVIRRTGSDWMGWNLEISHPGGLTSIYKLLQRPPARIRVGAKVRQGQFLALSSGSQRGAIRAGASTGGHLHYGLRRRTGPVDPKNFHASWRRWGSRAGK